MITCAPHLPGYLADELRALGYPVKDTHPGGIITRGSFADCMELNLKLRTAYCVLYLLRQFRCGSPSALYKQTVQVPWENIIDPAEKLTVVSTVDTWSVDNSMFASVKTKDAIVDRISRKVSDRPDSSSDRSAVVINLYWHRDRAWLYLNTSGRKLSDRGYRKMPHKAPLRETLAAGILYAAGYTGNETLILPMCGSGTLAIEAGLIAQKKPAAVLRPDFGFKHTKLFDDDQWQNIRSQARKQIDKSAPKMPVIATDIDPEAVRSAVQNARTAGLEQVIKFDTCDFEQTKMPFGPGIIIINPEYGLRLGDTTKLEETYRRLGDFLKNCCKGKTAYIFSGNKSLTQHIRLKASRKIPFRNASVDCRLLEYRIY